MPPFSLRTSRSCIDRELVAVTCPLVILMGVWDVSVCLTMLGYVLKSGVDNSIKDVGDMRDIYTQPHQQSSPLTLFLEADVLFQKSPDQLCGRLSHVIPCQGDDDPTNLS